MPLGEVSLGALIHSELPSNILRLSDRPMAWLDDWNSHYPRPGRHDRVVWQVGGHFVPQEKSKILKHLPANPLRAAVPLGFGITRHAV